MNQRLAREDLEAILQAEDVETLSVRKLMALTREEINDFLPDGVCRVDPRNGDRILYHSSRGGRPHDNVPDSAGEIPQRECIICQGQTTGVVDVAELSEGFTFINKNLFPVLYPFRDKGLAVGLHFLQWTSSQHDKDWHNMPLCDRIVAMERLAALERTLMAGADELMPIAGDSGDHEEGPMPGRMPCAFVVIIKNYGHLVGGSLVHGHQQIAFSNVMPRRFEENARFEQEHGETFSTYMIRETPSELVVKDYGPAILLVPSFMRRPYDTMLLLKDTSKGYLHQLGEQELEAVAEGWHDGLLAIREIMPRLERETAYSVITNNGPGAGLYFEFLPFTQEIGGVEQLGLLVCQELPEKAASRLREIIS